MVTTSITQNYILEVSSDGELCAGGKDRYPHLEGHSFEFGVSSGSTLPWVAQLSSTSTVRIAMIFRLEVLAKCGLLVSVAFRKAWIVVVVVVVVVIVVVVVVVEVVVVIWG